MNGSAILRGALGFSHQVLEGAVKNLDSETLHRQPAGTIGSIAAIYAHTIFDEDFIIQGMAQGKPPIYVSGDWAGKAGVPLPSSPMQSPEWDASVRIPDLAAFREYAAAVHAAADAYLASLTEADLDRIVEGGPGGKMALGDLLARLAIWHTMSHQGEISALLGTMGKKGLPF